MAGLADVRPYFRARMNSLSGYKEHRDGFNFDNIPRTIFNKAYHIENPSGGRRGPYDNLGQDIEEDVILRVFYSGRRNVGETLDSVMTNYQTILETILDKDQRLGTEIKNVYLTNKSLLPLAEDNDNAIILEIEFTCLVTLCF